MKISAVIANYNYGRFLPEALESLLQQTLQDFEIILIDDASTDNSSSIISEYEAKYPDKLRVYKNEKNSGVCFSIKRGISLAKGEYIGLFSSDDKWEPNFFEEIVNFMEKHLHVAFCCSNVGAFDSKEKTVVSFGSEEQVIYPKELAKRISNSSFLIHTNTGLYRRKFHESIQWDSNLGYMYDWLLNYQIACRYPIAYLPKTLSWLRVQEPRFSTQAFASVQKRKQMILSVFNTIDKDKPLRKFVRKSGLLGSLARTIYLYIILRPALWPYLPKMVYRRSRINA